MKWSLQTGLTTINTVNVLQFQTPKCLTKWHMQIVQTQIKLFLRSSLNRVFIVCHSTKHLRDRCLQSKISAKKKAWNKVLKILGHLTYPKIWTDNELQHQKMFLIICASTNSGQPAHPYKFNQYLLSARGTGAVYRARTAWCTYWPQSLLDKHVIVLALIIERKLNA